MNPLCPRHPILLRYIHGHTSHARKENAIETGTLFPVSSPISTLLMKTSDTSETQWIRSYVTLPEALNMPKSIDLLIGVWCIIAAIFTHLFVRNRREKLKGITFTQLVWGCGNGDLWNGYHHLALDHPRLKIPVIFRVN